MLNHQTKIQNKTSGTMSCGMRIKEVGAVRECARKRSKTAESEDQNQRVRSSGRECCVGGGDRFVSVK